MEAARWIVRHSLIDTVFNGDQKAKAKSLKSAQAYISYSVSLRIISHFTESGYSMFKVSFSCSVIGNQVNEDYAAVGPTYAVLLDGASGITGTRALPHHSGSDAQWFSHFVGGRICNYLDASRGAVDSIRLAVDDSRDFISEHGVTDNEDLLPSSTLVVVSVTDDLVDIVSLGDSPVYICLKDGSLVTVSDSRIAELDQAAVDAMVDRSRGLAMSGVQKRAAINDVLLMNRQLKNEPDGYWILDSSGVALEHLNLMQLSVENADYVCAMSDGLERAFDLFGLADPAAFLATATRESFDELIVRLRFEEDQDPDFERHPRLKLHDDASYFMLRL